MPVVDRDLYSILGIGPDASEEEIKQRYRQLVRQFHPDVNLDKIAAHHKFVEIVDAYKTLSDPARRLEYDASLPGPKSKTSRTTRHAQRERPRAETYSWQEELRRRSLDSLITAAELYFIRGQVGQAIRQCQEALRKDRHNPHAYGLLGDIYREQGREDEAVLMYTYAAQRAGPTGDAVYLRKIADIGRRDKPPEKEGIPVEPVYSSGSQPTARSVVGSLVAIAAIVISLFFLTGDPGPLVAGAIPRNYLMVAAVDGLLAGFVLTWMRWIRHSDPELFAVSISDPGGSSVSPLGFYLAFAGIVFFWVAVVMYLVVAYFEEAISWSILIVFGTTLLLLWGLTVLCPQGRGYFLLGGGNLIFTFMLAGWILGSIGRNPW